MVDLFIIPFGLIIDMQENGGFFFFFYVTTDLVLQFWERNLPSINSVSLSWVGYDVKEVILNILNLLGMYFMILIV